VVKYIVVPRTPPPIETVNEDKKAVPDGGLTVGVATGRFRCTSPQPERANKQMTRQYRMDRPTVVVLIPSYTFWSVWI
jgi:hypothetical protein